MSAVPLNIVDCDSPVNRGNLSGPHESCVPWARELLAAKARVVPHCGGTAWPVPSRRSAVPVSGSQSAREAEPSLPITGHKEPPLKSSGAWGAHLSEPPTPFLASPSSTLFSGVLALPLRGHSGPSPALGREYLAHPQITTFLFANASYCVLHPSDIKFNDSLKTNPSTG